MDIEAIKPLAGHIVRITPTLNSDAKPIEGLLSPDFEFHPAGKCMGTWRPAFWVVTVQPVGKRGKPLKKSPIRWSTNIIRVVETI